MQMGPETVVVQSRDPVAVEVDRTVVMMGLEQGKYYGLEGVGGRIWALIESPRSIRDICAALALEYEVEPDVCLDEVTAFLNELVLERLVRVTDETTTPPAPPSPG
jgi:hypothetical protein